MLMFLWEKTYNKEMYTHNRVPHRELGNIKPEDVFLGKKSKDSHFRINIAY